MNTENNKTIFQVPTKRQLVFPSFLFCLYAVWFMYMCFSNRWHFFAEFWQMPLTMSLGSFIAGSTPSGGAAVAFPVFTKVLNISSDQVRTFGLMIQSIGMTSAALFIWHRRIPVLWNVVCYASLGGLVGTLIAVNFVNLPAPYPKILFTTLVSMFAIALVYVHCTATPGVNTDFRSFGNLQRFEFMLAGLIGGMISDAVGSGIDLIVFMSLALCYRMCEKVSIPTTVICMAINSIIGFALHATVVNDVHSVWNYWLVCIPIVAIGAPLGALLMTYWSRIQIISLICILILCDVISSVAILRLNNNEEFMQTLFFFVLACTCIIILMARRGKRIVLSH